METITVNNKSFNIVKLLGKGKGGYSYLADDGCRQYVVKKIHHEPCDYYTFGNKIEAELNDYRRLCDAGIRIPHMIDIDTENETILKEYIEGDTIYQMVKDDKDVSNLIEQVKAMCSCSTKKDLTLITFQRTLQFRIMRSSILTMNAIHIWMSGTLKTGESNTIQKQKNFQSI